MKDLFEKLVCETREYLEKNYLYSMVLGISGGLDSTVTAAICHEVEKRNPEIKFYGISLPCSSNTKSEISSAITTMKAFCNEDQWWEENLQKEYMLIKSTCSLNHLTTTIGQGNIKARLRMIYLYDVANYTSGLVMDTDNLTEHYLGFFTIHGDQGDLNPIGGLWKHEVYKLARWLFNYNTDTPKKQALLEAINIMPTDGNGVNNLGDMGQIAPAFVTLSAEEAYTRVDDIISRYLEYSSHHPEEYQEELGKMYKKYGEETVDGIIKRIIQTSYKRKPLPVVIK